VLHDNSYPRDMIGYGANMIDPHWPGNARIAVQIALNYEGGAGLNVLHGDAGSASMLTDTGFPAVAGQRSMLPESSFEYGSRRGVWRILRVLRERQIKIRVFGVAMALERNPASWVPWL
jgi:allantoinase